MENCKNWKKTSGNNFCVVERHFECVNLIFIRIFKHILMFYAYIPLQLTSTVLTRNLLLKPD
jgi:hypothetical protein